MQTKYLIALTNNAKAYSIGGNYTKGFYMAFDTAQKVAQKITALGLSQAQAAERIGISQPTFGRILKGENDTKSTIFQKMNTVLSELQQQQNTEIKEGAA